MANKILIASDSTTDLGDELIEKFNIKILPLSVILDDKTYTDGVDINPDMIYEHYKNTGSLPKTSAVNIADTIDFFEKYTSEGYDIVYFTISSDLSSTYNNACIAAKEFSGVHIVDTRNLSNGGGLLVMIACEMAQKGISASEISEKCRQTAARVDATFIIDSLEFLHKGGRCSALAALGANLLQLKPCLTVRDGKINVGKKYRGKFSSVMQKYIKDMLSDTDDIETDYIFIEHAGCDEKIYQDGVELVKSILPFKQVFLTRAGSTISSHCGKDTFAIFFIRKTPLH